MTRARVIGAGLSGLASAWYLTRLGAEVEIVEASSRAGGLIGTRVERHGLVETAANALLWTPDVQALFADLAIEPVRPRPGSGRRYLARDGMPRRWPLSAVETAVTAARFGRHWAGRSLAPLAGESVAAWGRRTLGAAATRHVLEPALQGIYAAPAADLSAEALGLGRRRSRSGLAAPRDGMGQLIEALRDALVRRGARFRFDAPVDGVDRGVPTMISTNAREAARLAASAGVEDLAGALQRVQMLPLVTATAFFEPTPSDLRGFGVLFPRESARALGALFNSDTFAHRSEARSETWIFGDPRALAEDDAGIQRAIERDRHAHGVGSGALMALHVTRVPAALPVYGEAILAVRDACASLPRWLGVCGNYAGTVGAAALVTRARTEAARLLSA